MKKIFYLIYCFFFLLLLFSCSRPHRNDIIGEWESEDNSIFQFEVDSTLKVKDIPESIIFEHFDSKKFFSDSGKLQIQKVNNNYKIELLFPQSNELPRGFATYLNLERKFCIGKLNLFFGGGNFEYKYLYSKK